MRGIAWALLCVVTLLFACGKDEEETRGGEDRLADAKVVSKGSLGPVTATLRMDPAEPRFGDRIHWLLSIEAKPTVSLGEFPIGARFGHFRVRGSDELEVKDRNFERRYRIEVELEHGGANVGSLPPIPFEIEAGEGAGTMRQLKLPPIEVTAPQVEAEDHPDLATLGPPMAAVPLPKAVESTPWWMWAVGGGVLLWAIAVFWLVRRRAVIGNRREPVIDPMEEARRALQALRDSGLREAGDFGSFYAQLSYIPRRYIERTTGIHAPEQTTEEFLREMQLRGTFGDERRQSLQRFLEAADLIKFAGAVPGDAEIEDALRRTEIFCDLVAEAPAEGANS